MCLFFLKKCLRQLTAFQADRYANCTRPRSISVILGHHKYSANRTGLLCAGNKRGKKLHSHAFFDFKSIQVRPETRGTMKYCLICQIGCSKLQEKHPLKEQTTIKKEPSGFTFRKRFAPPMLSNKVQRKPSIFSSKRCKSSRTNCEIFPIIIIPGRNQSTC